MARAIPFMRTLTLAAAAAFLLAGCETHPNPTLRAQAYDAYAVGNYELALTRHRQIAERYPQNARTRFDIGRTLTAMGRHADAADEFEIAHQLSPNNDEYFLALAEAQYAAGRHERMIANLRKRAGDSGRPADWIMLGDFQLRLGATDDALVAYRQAAGIDRGRSVEPQLALARFYRSIGDNRNELVRLRSVLFLDAGNEAATRRLRELGHVPGPGFAIQPPELGG